MNHQLESRMRENRLSGSEGGGIEFNRSSLPLSCMPCMASILVRLRIASWMRSGATLFPERRRSRVLEMMETIEVAADSE